MALVLIVDDSPTDVHVMQKALEQGGFRTALAADGGEATLDFNYSYNPSCAYNSRWACPLAPPENRLSEAVAAGELAFPDPA